MRIRSDKITALRVILGIVALLTGAALYGLATGDWDALAASGFIVVLFGSIIFILYPLLKDDLDF